jgi:hypothetical protein
MKEKKILQPKRHRRCLLGLFSPLYRPCFLRRGCPFLPRRHPPGLGLPRVAAFLSSSSCSWPWPSFTAAAAVPGPDLRLLLLLPSWSPLVAVVVLWRSVEAEDSSEDETGTPDSELEEWDSNLDVDLKAQQCQH